jgi:hypothetical protein
MEMGVQTWLFLKKYLTWYPDGGITGYDSPELTSKPYEAYQEVN